MMMNQLIKKFPAQIKEAIEIGETATIRPHHFQIHKVVMAGMGGSAIGGSFVADIIAEECISPYIVVSAYHLPAYVDKHTLVIISSYSGNTEETVSALEQAIATGSKVVCIASGGKVKEIALQQKLDFIELPSGWPSPRACLGFSLVQQLYVLYYLGLVSKVSIVNIKSASDLLNFEQEDIMMKAEKLAALIFQKMPVLYTCNRTESVAVRWRQQLNENAKILCWHNVIPEMNHNELVGWKNKHENLAVIFLRYKDDVRNNQIRMDFTKQIVTTLAFNVIEIYAKGQTLPEKMIYLTHLGDWVSWYLALQNKVDPSEIKVIDSLKLELEKNKI